jgi:site-specific DNA recombinase
MTRAAFYARVSSQKQSDEKTIQSQCKALRERSADDGYDIPKNREFCDDGYSGSELLRPALETMRDQVHAGLIDKIYILSADRLARSLSHQMLLLDEFQRKHCEVIFLDQKGIPNGPEGTLLTHMQGAFAEYERTKILERTRRGRKYSAVEGKVSVFGRAPYGYVYVPKSQGVDARWEIDPIKSDHVRLIFELYCNQQLSFGRIARHLRESGICSSQGNPNWHKNSIREVLANPAYYGEAMFGKTRISERKSTKRPSRGSPEFSHNAKIQVPTLPAEQIKILVPAIIDRSMFETARIQMDENRKRHRQDKAKGKYLLSGFTMCGRCGAAYCSRIARGNNKYHYYRCLRSDASRTALEDRCENKSVKGAELEQMVWDEICKLLQDPARLKQELVRQHHKDDIDEKLRLAQREAINVVKQIDRLIDLYTEDKITKDELDRRLPELRKRQEKQSLEIKKYEQDQLTDDTLQDVQTRLEELAQMVQSQLSTADWCLKRELCQLLVKRIEIHDQEIKIVLKAPHLPFDYGPDENRGFLHQRLPCVAQPNGLGAKA